MNVFISALDWGLGHATRIIPIISEQIQGGNKVILGASENQKIIYREFFPHLTIEEMPSSPPIFGFRRVSIISILKFIPKFHRLIKKENKILSSIVEKHSIQRVISDNSYGLYNKNTENIIVTHQLRLQLPKPLNFLKPLVYWSVRRFLNRFDTCYVPDFSAQNNLSGKLSHPSPKLKCTIKYIGPLSRFNAIEPRSVKHPPDLLILISGPEKQRTVFENKVLASLNKMDMPFTYLVIRGTRPEESRLENCINYASAGELKFYMSKAKYIICRSGYSTIMDLVSLGKTAMLVPTPGQTEQEYLAGYLSAKGLFLFLPQEQLDINQAIMQLKVFNPGFRSLNRFE